MLYGQCASEYMVDFICTVFITSFGKGEQSSMQYQRMKVIGVLLGLT